MFEAYLPLARGKGPADPTITETSRKERIRSNAEVFDFALTDADMHALNALDRTHESAAARR